LIRYKKALWSQPVVQPLEKCLLGLFVFVYFELPYNSLSEYDTVN
jgi:hypothetical protein